MPDTEPLEAEIIVHWIITGRVQGVSFRYFTQRTARELELAGWVKNLADGSVEALVSGPGNRVEALREKVTIGPPLARVDGVAEEAIDPAAADLGEGKFEIRY